eukprot:scaffold175784_cov32-Tisochrysis_lutea.AAC.3
MRTSGSVGSPCTTRSLTLRRPDVCLMSESFGPVTTVTVEPRGAARSSSTMSSSMRSPPFKTTTSCGTRSYFASTTAAPDGAVDTIVRPSAECRGPTPRSEKPACAVTCAPACAAAAVAAAVASDSASRFRRLARTSACASGTSCFASRVPDSDSESTVRVSIVRTARTGAHR